MDGYYLKHHYVMGRATGFCFNAAQAYKQWKMPMGKSSSEHLLNKTTVAACTYVPPVGVGVKHGSYERVLRRRKYVANLCTFA
jgi:hypothetical protein